MNYAIEARSFPILCLCCHNFWVLKDLDSGATIAELHGLAFDPATGRTLPIGYTREHRLRLFVYAHDAAYATEAGAPVYTTRMHSRSRSQMVYREADAKARWDAAVRAVPALNALDLGYPPLGFSLLTGTVNSNSAYRTFGEIMGVPVHTFTRAYGPGLRCGLIDRGRLDELRFS
ncbi:MAG TPA: hypothetical protein VED01_13550 [Burkholderiales bacterium]|nr:hypothetical protein [Burkholderiales bacterium]